MDTATQLRSALAGRYDIEREIGAGGMATVYLARDVRHDRHVALKVLNPELGAILGVERFLAEIRVTANLQHPNLLPLFDSGEADGLLFYVMPFVEGETLRTRLEREQQLPVDEAVHIAIAVASALGYAHAHHVIHRDLKPENILIQAGQPMVADFGIALAVSKAGGARITQTGLSLGTPQYMSPEQATGDRVIDGRSDIYSLAAVLYEMLAGEPPHQGQTVQAVIARVLTERPRSLRVVRPSVPEHVAAAIDRALEKLPADRFGSAQELADALSGRSVVSTSAASTASQPAMSRPARPRATVFVGMLVVALILASALAGWGWMRPDKVPRTPSRFVLGLPYEPRFTSGTGHDVAISPDGQTIVYVSRSGGRNILRIRPIGSLESRVLAGTEGGLAPFFSPDGAWVGFSESGKLRKIPVVGGASTVLADAPLLAGATWGPDNEIVYCRGPELMTVSPDGGEPRLIARLDTAKSAGCIWPEFLPGGKAVVLGIIRGSLGTSELAVVTMDGDVHLLGVRGVSPHYVRGGFLVFTRADGSVMMMRFDAKRLRALGPPIPTGETIQVKFGGATNLTVSRDGTAILLGGVHHLVPVLVDRNGVSTTLLDTPRQYRIPRFSPDGKRIAFTTNNAGVQDLWMYDLRSSTLTRLASGDDVHQPEWTPDGKRISYTAVTGNTAEDIMWQPVDGSAPAEPLINLPGDQYDATWSPDGKTLVYMYDDPDPAHPSIGVMNMSDRIPKPWLATPNQERSSRVSRRGDLIAYASDESGRQEVYVRPFPHAGGRVQVSSGGGGEPIWAPDGRTLYYRDADKMMVASIGTSPELSVSARRVLFEQPYFADGTHTFYDLSPDGKTFLMFKAAEELTQFLVVVNWDEELRRRAEMSAAR